MRRGAIGILAVLALLTASGAWLAGTESGLRAAWRVAARLIPAELEVGALAGRLGGTFAVHDLRFHVPGLHGSAERVEVEWQPSALLRGTLSVAALRIVGLDIVREPSVDADEGPVSLPERLSLPVDVDVALLVVEDLRWRSSVDAESVAIDEVRFALRFDNDVLEIDALEVRGPMFAASGRGELAPHGSYPAALALDATISLPGRPDAAATLRGAGSLDALTVRIEVAPPYALDAEVLVVDVITDAVLDGTLRARLVPAEVGLDVPVAEAAMELTFAGVLDDLRMTGRADAAIPSLADADLVFAGRWLGDALLIESLEVGERGGPAAVRLAGRVDVAGPSGQLEGDWSGLRWPLAGEPLAASPRGTLELTGTPELLEARLAAEWDADGRINGVARRDGERIDVGLEWRDISWPPAAARLESANGTLRVTGTLDDYALMLDAELAAAEDFARGVRTDGAAGHLRAEGRGDSRRLDLALIDIAVLDGELHGSGRVEWDPVVAAAVDVEFASLDPGLLLPEWSGRVSGGMTAEAAVVDGGFAADIARIDIEGTLRGRPIDLDARGRYETPNRADVEELTLRSGTSTVVASGSVGERIDIEWRIDSPDLDDLWPGVAGRLTSSGQASGPLARPQIEADASGESLVVDGIEIGRLSLAARVDVAGDAESSLVLDVGDASIAGRSIERLEIRGSGTAQRHRGSMEVSVDGIESALALSGVLARPWESSFNWRFAIDEGRVSHQSLPAWTLDGAAAGMLTADGAELERACLRSDAASLCVDAARRGARTDVRIELDALPFEHFAAFLPRDTRVTGEFSGEGRLELAPHLAPRASLTLATTPARIAATGNGPALPGLAFAAGRAAFAFDDNRLDAELELPLARGEGGIDGRAAVTLREDEPLTTADIDGRLRAEFDNLAFLSDLVRGVDGTTGSLSVDVELSGAAAAPRFAGDAVLSNGSVRLREPGIVVEAIDAVLAGDGTGRITIGASATSGGGALEAAGELHFADALPIGRIGLRGDMFELANTPDARLWASPDLVLDMAAERIDLSGRVLIPRARFTPRDFSDGAVAVSSDQIIVDAEETPTRRLSRPFYARVALTLGDDVTFNGFGLTGSLGGAIDLVEIPAEPVTGSGELRVRSGTYEAYGQVLEVRTGRLLFAGGAVSRPGLDIEAVRRPTEDILVGARVRGTLDLPELTVFSEPSMPRQEQLSYLLLGRPLESASGSETSALSQAAMVLGLRGGNFVSDRLNESLGFDEFGLQSQAADANSASFVIGKYLTPSLYVSYGVGLFESVNTLRLRFTISRRWRLVTESSTVASGGDLIYHVERGE